ncbi:MAG: arginine--tRNA ligase [Candidatus Magasanikbacteria bacterium RIFCSPHIGHO2_02_FULL_51_14]|uniref:Arginine--tRNA ligase n=1 Tax=Candidatus Magasanikbacteria bacterium RIFCSPHIGHO2_02_FULL_51_14 TaxID=1798683 RepID=A0A1F6MPY4_9BACT|nr:MAG: arginine--tRNA ligase [Candidatus Magasanikbacteria bacterium RIFCSPHIGHO2_02_FULL_51_14]
MIKIIEQQIIDLLAKADITGENALTSPPNPEMGDFSFACFDSAKKEGKNPKDVAEEIVGKIKRLKDYKIIEEVKAVGPYVNFFLNTSEIARLMAKEMKNTKEYGATKVGKGKKVMIEYPSQNSHKEFHIGHLRNVCIGNTLVQLYRKNGYHVVPVNYVNDFGAHVVKCLWGIQKFHEKEMSRQADIENKQQWLGEVYAEASEKAKEFPGAQKEIDALQQKLEARDEETFALFRETRAWSEQGFDNLLAELDVVHADVFYESDLKDRGQEIVDELLKKGIAKKGEKGAIIIDLEKDGLDIALLRKATGAGLYLTSDLALAEEKFKKYPVDESVNITGTEQNFYFKQLFTILECVGFEHKMTHIGYGLVNLPEGKMSSRAGNVILYEDIRDQVFSRLLRETEARHSDWTEAKREDVAQTLTQGVLKFTMQKHEASKNITFDIKEATSIEGYSAPYVLYVVARINSLLRKSQAISHESHTTKKLSPITYHLSPINYDVIVEPEEKRLLLLIARYPEVVIDALQTYNPSAITRYSFDLAQAFNDFYNKHSVLEAGSDDLVRARLALSGSVKHVLEDALGLLTIETVDIM